MKILVTDGNTRAALSIVRSLGEKKYAIHVGAKKHPSLASSSKYCLKKMTYPDPEHDPEYFTEFIIDYLIEENIDILLPVTEITISSLLEKENQIRNICSFPVSDEDVFDHTADKYKTFKLAESLSIPIPRTIYLTNPEYVKDFASLGYPIVIKPSRSRYRTTNGWKKSVVSYANNNEELKAILNAKNIIEYPLLLQERIIGSGTGVFLLIYNGQTQAIFSHRRIREKPPSGGVSTYRESIRTNPETLEYAEKLLNSIGWSGVAMVEFKLDQRDQCPKLMEINGRFWGSLQLAIDAGVDFPFLLIDAMNGKKNRDLSYDLGIRTRWFWGDVDALFMVMFKNATTLNLPAGHPSRLSYLMNFLKFWRRGDHFEVLSYKDIRPWLFESLNWIQGHSI